MKKRNLLVVLMVCLCMLLTACEGAGKSDADKIQGKWEAEWNITDYVLETLGEEMADYEDCFEDMILVVTFEFEEDEVVFAIEEDSLKGFADTMETSMINLFDTMMGELATEMSMSVEDVYTALGTTRDAYVEEFLESMDIDSLVEEMMDELEASAEYELDEEDGTITITYEDEDEDEEEWKYEFDEDTLNITFEVDDMEVEFECERK